MTRAGLLACGAIACGLGATIAAELSLKPDAAPTAAPGPASAAVRAAPGPTLPDQTERFVMASLARPLFSPHRRPPATPSGGPVASGPGLPRLAGTMVSGAGRQAIFAGDTGARPTVVGEGAAVGAWTVRSIGAGAVEMSGPGGARTLHPSFDRNAAVSASPAPAAANDEAGPGPAGLLLMRRPAPARPGR